MVMDREKAISGTKKCRKFTALVDFHKTIAVVSSALSRGCIPLFHKQHKDERNFYKLSPLRRAMIRPYFVALAAGAMLVLQTGVADARRSGSAPAQYVSTPSPWAGQTGQASYYGKAHHGKRTASGARFDQNAMTAAHPSLPFGTRIKVTHVATGRSIIVTINDRLPSRRRVIDLSYGAAQQLGILRQGVAQVVLSLA
jgi:rare lipoprotein A